MIENVAKLTEAEKALLKAAATIGAIYETLAMVNDTASAAAFIKAMRKNAGNVEQFVMKPAREIIAKVPKD